MNLWCVQGYGWNGRAWERFASDYLVGDSFAASSRVVSIVDRGMISGFERVYACSWEFKMLRLKWEKNWEVLAP